mgnify:CR=1 FL=1|jgi:hypothetical protein
MARKPPKNLLGGGQKVRVIVDEKGVEEILKANKSIRDLLVKTGQAVAANAQATASAAEKGPGGNLTGYADAGFSVEWDNPGNKRPRVNVRSNADGELATRVHFYTQKRDGVGHLRKALYDETYKA